MVFVAVSPTITQVPRMNRHPHRRLALALVALSSVSMPALAQNVPGFSVETYAENVPGPVFLSFAEDGTLFCGHDPSSSGSITPFPLTRIGIGGSPVTAYGSPTPDPDPVVVDTEGVVSGVPGSVLTGGYKGSTSIGAIWAVRPDESTVELWESSQWRNPSEMKFDDLGRLLFIDIHHRSIWTSNAGEAPTLLANMPGAAQPSHMAIASDNRIFVSDMSGRVHVFDEDGTLLQANFASLPSRSAIEFGSGGQFGEQLYALEVGVGRLHRIAADGSHEQIGDGFAGLSYDLAFGPDGRLYVSHLTAGRISVITPDRIFSDGFESP